MSESGSAPGKGLWMLVAIGLALVVGAGVGLLMRGSPQLVAAGGKAAPAAPAASKPAVQPASPSPGPTRVSLESLREVLEVLEPGRREALLADAQSFQRFVGGEVARAAVLDAARATGVESDERVQLVMRRASEKALMELYLRNVVAGRVEADFPSEAQMREFYEANTQLYTTEERVAVWQVFFPLPEEAGEQQVAAVRSQAESTARDIERGEMSLAQAALRFSGHPKSRANGGYMGLLKVSELLPELREQVLALPEGRLSEPLRGPKGFHLVRRGTRVPQETLAFESVREAVQARLRTAAAEALRKRALEQLLEKHGQPVSQADLEAWREALAADEKVAAGG